MSRDPRLEKFISANAVEFANSQFNFEEFVDLVFDHMVSQSMGDPVLESRRDTINAAGLGRHNFKLAIAGIKSKTKA